MKKARFPKKSSLKMQRLSNPNLSLSWPSLKAFAITLLANSRKVSHLPNRIPNGSRADIAQRFCYDQGRAAVDERVELTTPDRSLRWGDLIAVRAGGESWTGSVTHE